jgi:HEAT repeat protein
MMVLLVTMMLLQLDVTQAAQGQRLPGVLIEELRSAEAAGNEADRHQARERLSALGEPAIPSIREALKGATGAVRLELLFAIGGIEGDAATSALLELAATDSDEAVRGAAMNLLSNRAISRPVSEGEKNMLLELVSKAPAVGAATASQVLANCSTIASVQRARVIVSRFLKEASVPSKTPVARYMGSYLSAEVMELNGFIIALVAIDDPDTVVRLLKEAASTLGGNERTRKWSMVAQGFVGSEDVADSLKQLVETEADESIKAVTLRAYARSAKRNAIPLLEHYLKQSTASKPETPIMIHRSGDPLEIVARDELALLREEGGE